MAAITGRGLGRKTIGYDLANARHVEEGWQAQREVKAVKPVPGDDKSQRRVDLTGLRLRDQQIQFLP